MSVLPEDEEPLDVSEVRKVHRITLAHIFHSIFDAFNIDRGGVFTLKQLLRNPGAAVQDYLGANRYHYTPPFRLLIVTTALTLFMIGLSEFVESAPDQMGEGFNSETKNLSEEERLNATAAMFEILSDIQAYFNLLLWTFIPFIALFTWLVNLKKKYNFAEHLVFQTYLFSISNIIGFILPLDHFVPWWVIMTVVYILMFFYYIYAYREFLKKSTFRSILEMAMILVFSLLLWSTLIIIVFALLILLQTK
jgi:hypothetical protein